MAEPKIHTPVGSAPVIPLIMMGIGGYLAWFGIHYWRRDVKWPSDPVKAILTGKGLPAPGTAPQSANAALTADVQALQPDTGAQPQTNAGSTPAGGVPSAGGNPGAVNGCTANQTSQNRATGALMAGAYGWGPHSGDGSQWAALDRLLGSQESGWCNVAQNPGSTAYGIGQFLDTTWATVGYSKTSDAVTQIAATLAYIKQRYGNPVAAEQFHLANNYY